MRKSASTRVVLAAVLLLAVAVPAEIFAGWSNNPAVNTPVARTGAADSSPAIISDGSGGAIIAWMGYQINAQKIDSKGYKKWGPNGVIVSAGGSSQYYPQLVSDGSGGAIITWQDGSTGPYQIYAQRVDADGNVMWAPYGVPISLAANNQQFPQIAGDGGGGAIITWQDSRVSEDNYDIYAQRIDANGNVQWTADGVPICTEGRHQYYPQIISDGNSGAIITWQDSRVHWSIYAQRINSSGNVLWTANGVAVSTSNDPLPSKLSPQIIGDGSGGAIITWQDNRGGATGQNIFAQRVNSDGDALWIEEGAPVSTALNVQGDPHLVSDGSGGAIISWWDLRNGANWHIYAQRIDANGAGQWTPDGVLVCNEDNIDIDYYAPQLVSDGNHGAILTWAHRPNPGTHDIYAQRIGAGGAGEWAANGVPISTAANHQQHPKLISLAGGGAIITWQDVRSGGWDIYAQKVLADGALPVPLPPVIADFDEDGSTNVAAYHLPTDQLFTDYAGNMGQYGWGGADCYPLVWDYDGDGITEVSIYHIPTNQWFVRGYPGDNLGQFGWGEEDCIPVPGDYDGDGIMERAFYHTPSNTFFIEVQGGPPTLVQFGWNGAECIPVPGDYDGDGTTDLVIYHLPTNQWLMHGFGNLGQYGWGGADCLPVPGDFDGNGSTDIAVYHVPTNQWFVKGYPGDNLGQYGWGGMDSFPVPGDYDGDGAVERGFYRHGENRWFIEGRTEFVWGWGGEEFMPITSQTAVFNWFRFVLGRFQ